jgi:hypothetical protein
MAQSPQWCFHPGSRRKARQGVSRMAASGSKSGISRLCGGKRAFDPERTRDLIAGLTVKESPLAKKGVAVAVLKDKSAGPVSRATTSLLKTTVATPARFPDLERKTVGIATYPPVSAVRSTAVCSTARLASQN